MNFENWNKATYQHCEDPTEFNGENKKCNLCEKDAEMDDEYCEDHQGCNICGEREKCEEECGEE